MKILLTHAASDRNRYYGSEALAALRALGKVRLNDTGYPLDTAGLMEMARNCDVIVSDRQTAGEAALFEALPELAAFLRVAVDIRNVAVDAASRQGILVCHASPGFVDSVAELTIGFLVDLARGISRSVGDHQRGVAPEIRMGVQLSGSTLGIIGYGTIGQRVAALARALGMRVVVTDPRPAPDNAEQVPLPGLLAQSRFVLCLAAATPETERMMDAAAFAAMAPGGFFLNLSRGELVDDEALLQTLESGHLAGAALDVGRAPDQMPAPALARHPRVIATPHIGGLTPEAIRHQAFDTVRQVEALAAGRMPEGAVNAEAARRLHLLDRRAT
jgi:D-3-phosphoglycerate dehydrogenase